MAENNTLNEWSDGEDDWIFDVNGNNVIDYSDLLEWSNPESAHIVVDDSERSLMIVSGTIPRLMILYVI